MTGDILVEFKIKNARLLRAVRRREPEASLPEFCRRHGFGYQSLNEFLCMRRSPLYRKSGEWTVVARRLAEVLLVDPGDIWPEALRISLEKTKGEFEVSIDEARMIASGATRIDRQAFRLLASALKPREAIAVLGFANGEILKDTGKKLGVCVERTRAIQRDGIRRMRQRAKALGLKFTDVIEL